MVSISPSRLIVAMLLPLSLCASSCTQGTGDSAVPERTTPPIDGVQSHQHEEIGSIVVVQWEQLEPATAWVEFSVDEGIWHKTPAREVERGSTEQLLLGAPYGVELDLRVVNDLGYGPLLGGEQGTSTAALPEVLAHGELLTADPGAYEQSAAWFLGSFSDFENGESWVVILDRAGRLVWAWEVDGLWHSQFSRPSVDGTELVMDYNSYWRQFDGGEDARVRRYRIDGTLVQEIATPGMFQAWTELPDGSIVYGSGEPVEKLLEIGPSGAVRELWDCEDFLVQAELEGRGCHSNFVHHDPVADTILLSCISHETLLEVQRGTGELLRWFGRIEGDWTFDPPESQFWWQHGAHYLDDGTLMVSTRAAEEGQETLVRQYQLDHEYGVLRQIWSFGEGEGVYAKNGGGAHRLANGNTLLHYGGTPRIREVTADAEVVWDVQWELGEIRLGYIWPLEDLYGFAP